MTSRPRLSGILRKLFFVEANQLAAQAGVIQRQRVFSGASLLQLLVFGWLKHPQAGPSQLARFAGSLGLKLSKQAVEERFTRRTANWLLAVLRRGVQFLVCAEAVSIPLLQRFTAVLVEDGSSISLPAALKQVWRGCGGSASEAALKLTVRLDLLAGGLSGPYVQEGRSHETQSPLREQQMPRGSLWIGDLGYFALTWLTQLVKQGVFAPSGVQRAGDRVECRWRAGGGAGPLSDGGGGDGGHPGGIRSAQAGAGAPDRQADVGGGGQAAAGAAQSAGPEAEQAHQPPAVGTGAVEHRADQCAPEHARSSRSHGLDACPLAY